MNKISLWLKEDEDTIHLFDIIGHVPNVGSTVYFDNLIPPVQWESYKNGDLKGFGRYPNSKFVVSDVNTSVMISSMRIADILAAKNPNKNRSGDDADHFFHELEQWATSNGCYISGILWGEKMVVLTRQTVNVTIRADVA